MTSKSLPFFIAFKPITDGKEGKEDLDLKGGSFLSKAHCTRGLNELILIYWTINAQFCLFWMGNRKPRASNERFFFSSKMPQDLLEAITILTIINPLYFCRRISRIIAMVCLTFKTSIAKCILSFWNAHQTLLETKKTFFLCCSNDVELNMSIVKFEFEFTRLSAFTMTWQSSFLPWH